MLSVFVHAMLFAYYGIRQLDDSLGYLDAAKYLAEHGKLGDIHHLFYASFIVPLAIFKFFLPAPTIAFVIFQSVLSIFSTILLYFIGARVFKSDAAGFWCGLIFTFWIDNRHWDVAIMSESLMSSTIILFAFLLIEFPKRYGWLILAAVILCLARPTSLVPLFGFAAFVIASHVVEDRKIFPISIAIFLLSVVAAGFMFLHWDFTEQYVAGNVVTYMDYTQGKPLHSEWTHLSPAGLRLPPTVGHPMLKLFLFAVYNPWFTVKLTVLKMFFLLFYIRPYYSIGHNIFLMGWMIVIYVCTWFGFRKMIRSPFKVFLCSVIVLNTLLVGAATVDWDNRFYIPMEIGVVVLAGGGLGHLGRRIAQIQRV